jgi:peptidoglycan/xylan/chitin deacetylase (PgdA/CDA1 family)
MERTENHLTMDVASRIFRIVYPSVCFETASNDVHLTFDDGPHPVSTPIILDLLRRFDVKATFFPVGETAARFPDLIRQIAAAGHGIGNHTQNHANLLLRTVDSIEKEITGANLTIHGIIGQLPKLFRPPFGYYDYRTLRIARRLGLRVVHWSFDIRDFSNANFPTRITRTIREARRGSIVLLHNNERSSRNIGSILPMLVEGLRQRGITIGPLPS